MRTMEDAEIDAFVATRGFGVLSLADGNRAYGVPLFYGARDGALYFQTRAGKKTHYLYATMEACLTIASPRGQAEWASVQLLGRLERVDAISPASVAHRALVGVPPPFAWSEGDANADEGRRDDVTTFRLVPTERVGRHSQPATLDARERDIGF